MVFRVRVRDRLRLRVSVRVRVRDVSCLIHKAECIENGLKGVVG